MFVHPSSSFYTYSRNAASPYSRQAHYGGHPSSSCRGQHHQPESAAAYYSRYATPAKTYPSACDDVHMTGDDDDDTTTGYYQYLLEAARREQKQKELRRRAQAQAQAEAEAQRAQEQQELSERRAAQQIAFLKARARAVAQAEAEAEANAAREKQQRQSRLRQHRQFTIEEQHRRYMEHKQRQAKLWEEHQEQERQLALQARAVEIKRRQALAEHECERELELRKQQRIRAAKSIQDELARAIFGQFAALPAPRSSTPSPSKTSTAAPTPTPAGGAKSTAAPQAQPATASQPRQVHFVDKSVNDKSENVGISETPVIQEGEKVRSVHSVRTKFEALKGRFDYHDTPVFDRVRSIPGSPFLAYNIPANRPLQEYEEHLTRLLTELDSITSEGIEVIRAERKALNTDVQRELSRLDEIRAKAWEAQQRLQQQKKEKEEKYTTQVQPSENEVPEAEAQNTASQEPEMLDDTKPETADEATTPISDASANQTSAAVSNETEPSIEASAKDSTTSADITSDNNLDAGREHSEQPVGAEEATSPQRASSPSSICALASGSGHTPESIAAMEPRPQVPSDATSPSSPGNGDQPHGTQPVPSDPPSTITESTSSEHKSSTATLPHSTPSPTDSTAALSSFMLPPVFGLELVAGGIDRADGEDSRHEHSDSDSGSEPTCCAMVPAFNLVYC